MGLDADQVKLATEIMAGIYKLFKDKDCSLVEINPLIVTPDGRLLGIDAKVNIDDNGVPYHKDIAELRDASQEDPLEVEAGEAGINYVKLDGNVGCLINGAGMAMATMDLIKHLGGEPANFLDIGGGASEDQAVKAVEILLSDPKVKVAWVNIFGGIMWCDLMARALIRAVKGKEVRVPIIVRMKGTNYEEGKQLLEESGINMIIEPDWAEAARKAVAMAKA
jgi:succinyl-CoA synthetase beta subunit